MINEGGLMRTICLSICLGIMSICAHAKSDFLPSSEQFLASHNSASLHGLNTFVFSFLLKMEPDEIEKTVNYINGELRKVGHVVKKEICTPNGMDLECFSNPSAQFIIERLTDEDANLLPVLRAQLAVTSVVEVTRNQELVSMPIKNWSVYLKYDEQNLQKVLNETVPVLLKQFLASFQESNPKTKPTFVIVYDASWWKGSGE